MADGEEKKKVRHGQENLIPFDQLPEEKQREIRSKGAQASAEVRRKKRDMRELARDLLQMKVPHSQESMRARMKALGFDEDGTNYSNAILASMLMQATNGDVNAAKFVRDTAGYVPEQNVNLNAEVEEKPRVVVYLPQIESDDEEEEETNTEESENAGEGKNE